MRRASPLGRIALGAVCLGSLALAAARLAGLPVPGAALAAALGALLAIIALGVFRLGSGVFGRPILAGRADEPWVALTFDDGPHPDHTRAVLDLLDARGHRGTFFVIGARAEAHPEVVAEIARRGHGLGNHSYAHSWLTPVRAVVRLEGELRRAGEAIARASGATAPRWFRPPIGLLSPPVAAAARRAGLELVGWTATARDGVAGSAVEDSLSRLSRALRPGAILVLHDAPEEGHRAPIAPAVLTRLLDELEQRGLRSVTLDELLLYSQRP